MLLVSLWHVFGQRGCPPHPVITGMRSDTHPAMKNFDSLRRETHFHFLMRQRMRHAVIVPLDFDVIVEVDANLLPLAELIAHGGLIGDN